MDLGFEGLIRRMEEYLGEPAVRFFLFLLFFSGLLYILNGIVQTMLTFLTLVEGEGRWVKVLGLGGYLVGVVALNWIAYKLVSYSVNKQRKKVEFLLDKTEKDLAESHRLDQKLAQTLETLRVGQEDLKRKQEVVSELWAKYQKELEAARQLEANDGN